MSLVASTATRCVADLTPLRQYAADLERQVPVKSFSRSVLQVMMALPWNGNATELKSLLGTFIETVEGPVIQLEDLLEHATLDGVAEPHPQARVGDRDDDQAVLGAQRLVGRDVQVVVADACRIGAGRLQHRQRQPHHG